MYFVITFYYKNKEGGVTIKAKSIAIFLLVAVLFTFTSLGYAQMTDLLSITGSIVVEPINDIYINSANVKSGNAKVTNYVNTVLSSSITLDGAGSSATITLTIINNSNTVKVFNTVKFMNEAYSNPNITFTLDGITTGTALSNNPADSTHTFTFDIIFTFKENDYSDPNLTSVLLFEFADIANWEEPVEPDTPVNPSEPTPPTPPIIEVGEDFEALIKAGISDLRGNYGLNDPQKGHVLESAVKKQGIVYSTDNLSGGHIKHFASTERNTHNLDFMFEYKSDTEYILYIWRLEEVNDSATVVGRTEVTVYKQAYHLINNTWQRSSTMAGRSVIQELQGNKGDSILAIIPSQWVVGPTNYSK